MSSSSSHPGFTPFTSMCFTVNYVMGTGFLTLPWAFQSSGIGLAILTLTFVGYVSNISKDYVLEAMARAEMLKEKKEGEESLMLPPADDAEKSEHTLPLVKQRKFEIIEMCTLFLGPTGGRAYVTTFSFYMYGCLWAYSSVFANAMAQTIPLNSSDDYAIYVIIFAVVTVPLTCMELREQVNIQIALSFCRFLMVVVIVSTVAAAFNATTPQFNEQTSANGTDWFNISGFYRILPIAVYANIYHHSLPGLSMPVEDKSKLGWIFKVVFMFMFVAYGLIGLSVAWYFGSDIESSANLNWHDYRAGTGENTSNDDDPDWSNRAAWVEAIVYFVVLFPALDVASAFPLNGITLGNCLMGSYYGSKIQEVETERKIVTMFRILAAVPPIFGSLFVRDLGVITDYTGITGFAIAFIFPALLHKESKRSCKKKGRETKTLYSGFFSEGDKFPNLMIAFGAFLVVFVFSSLVYDEAK
ncbi:hypothetical protein TrLO_g97 [Triparma laevis f. longispina]|uniref:Amino acid transporter transmembrane domain-containing protein n=1 Tax=Triparma laevis f. longispina TaxID=1714387 RepID=A0A9W7CGV5_9STRA|nr:hypothetical protein TrLO_g97 [Triparma laevis f. longispina]